MIEPPSNLSSGLNYLLFSCFLILSLSSYTCWERLSTSDRNLFQHAELRKKEERNMVSDTSMSISVPKATSSNTTCMITTSSVQHSKHQRISIGRYVPISQSSTVLNPRPLMHSLVLFYSCVLVTI